MSNANSTNTQTSAWEPLFLSVPAGARRLGIGQTTAWGLIKDRKLPTVRIGRRTLIPVAGLEAFAASLVCSTSR